MITKVVFAENNCTNLYREPFALSVTPFSYSSDPWAAVAARFLPLFQGYDASICSDQIVVSGVEIRVRSRIEGVIRLCVEVEGFRPGVVEVSLYLPLRSVSDWRFFEGLLWAAGAWEMEGGGGPKTSNPLADLLCGVRLLESKGVEWEFCLDRSGSSLSSSPLGAFADFAASVYPRLPSPSSR